MKADRLQIGIIGCGQWGMNHIRNFSTLPNSMVRAISDVDPDRVQTVKGLYPSLHVYADYREMVKAEQLDACVVATPTRTHHAIVRDLLSLGKHVLCEKPLCQTVEQGQDLLTLAGNGNRVLMVGHVFLFNPGIVKLKELVKSGNLGRVYYLAATRTNLGPIRQDVNAVFDLASHDISIFNFLLDGLPVEVSGTGMSFLQPDIEDVAFVSLRYPDDILANIRVSWLDPTKVRQLTIVGDRKMVTWDDLSQVGPVMIYDKGVTRPEHYEDYGQFQLLAKQGEILVPHISLEEPLKVQARHFLASIENGETPLSTGRFGVEVVKVLTAIGLSIRRHGEPIPVDR